MCGSGWTAISEAQETSDQAATASGLRSIGVRYCQPPTRDSSLGMVNIRLQINKKPSRVRLDSHEGAIYGGVCSICFPDSNVKYIRHVWGCTMNTSQRATTAVQSFVEDPRNGLLAYVNDWRIKKPKSDMGMVPKSSWRTAAVTIIGEFNRLPGNTPDINIRDPLVKNAISNCYDQKMQEFRRYMVNKSIALRTEN